jgi:CRP/FNR family transcriptional regulator, cyclic AMP receptor protein
MPVTADLLRSVPLFTGMTDAAIESVGGLAHEVQYAEGDQLVRQGDQGDSFLVIVEGRARVVQDGDTLRDLGPGDYLGEIALIDGGPRTATVTAIAPIRALVVERSDFKRLIDDFSAVRFHVLTALTQRIRREAPSAVD